MSIQTALAREKDYFQNHAVYSKLSDKLGIPFLSKSLNTILIYHIKKCIPSLNANIQATLKEKEREYSTLAISGFSKDDPLSDVDSGPLVLALINKFINAYTDKIEGRFVQEVAVELHGGSRINFIFHEIFRKAINEIDPFEYLTE